ncbi:hypothetical protein [Salipiger abyssi]|uniref:Uncharacterized protein n=1 Tax=Salipiger abyssi TaxID=1250539 RepID=A0A1P8UXN3_9RHOB|nr:hypothetical protein [Salipiger abyssi]ALF02101.1 hypothetical protein vBPeaSP1_010 [Pelagibaca phage vB_PeaS-P1]APZ54116.1 hypothetical protein Ga0080574_TMP3782 [Salipiger abyssi]
MFVFEPDYTFEWPVKVKYPSAGGEETREFTGIFRLPEDELEIYERGEQGSISEVIQAVRDRLASHWVGWRDIELKGGGDLAFSEDARARLLKQRPIREAVDRALSEAVLGIREKN